MSRGGSTTQLQPDPRCTTCTAGASGDLTLNSSYPLGPAAEIGDGGFHGSNFSSFHTYVLLQDSDDSERQGLAIRKVRSRPPSFFRVLSSLLFAQFTLLCGADALHPRVLCRLLLVFPPSSWLILARFVDRCTAFSRRA